MSDKVSQAVIIAGGRGERLRPFTDAAPKPLFPIGGVPFINRLLDQISSFGIKDVVILLGYRADQVMEEVGDGSRFGLNVRYDVTPPEYDTDMIPYSGGSCVLFAARNAIILKKIRQ